MKKKGKERLRKEPPPGCKYLTSPLTTTASKHLLRLYCIFATLTTNGNEKLFL